MPKKTTISKKAIEPADDAMEFEQFIAQKNPRRQANGKSWLYVTLIIIIIALAGVLALSLKNKSWQREIPFKVVALDNNQYYYAKIAKEDANYIYLDDVYYIQTVQKSVPATEEGAEATMEDVPVLVRRGQELHRPVGYMQISRSRIVAIEEIGKDSEIYKEIQKAEAQQ
ncbi:MAG: hypothetical protein WC465_01970 [Patescibacteria group bacterium]